MIDFKINERGDLVFEEAENFDKLRISFNVGEHPAMRLYFQTEDRKSPSFNDGFKIEFMVNDSLKGYCKVDMAEGIAQKTQEIRMRLMTEREELPKRKNFGSEYSKIRHERLYESSTITRVENATKEALADILPDARVIVKPELGIGNFYCQNMGVYIYSNGFLIFKFFI